MNNDDYFNWILKNKSELQIKIQNLDWNEWPDKPFFDVAVESLDRNIKTEGRGSDVSPITATLKATSEYIERTICVEHKISSNGVATQISKDLAEENAKNELLERHLVLMHIRENYPFKKINYNTTYLKKISEICDVNVFSTGTCNDVTAYIIRGKLKLGSGYVYITGTSLDRNLEIQFLRKFYSLKEYGFITDNEIQLNCLRDPTFGFNSLFESDNEKKFSQYVEINYEILKSKVSTPFITIRAWGNDIEKLDDSKIHFIG